MAAVTEGGGSSSAVEENLAERLERTVSLRREKIEPVGGVRGGDASGGEGGG